MCRYVAYLGEPLRLDELVYRPANSLVHQAAEAMESRIRLNADGFGLGWYPGEVSDEAIVFKDTLPVWNDANLRSIADKTRSSCIFAHVRAAFRQDPVTRSNCHPFQHGRLLWMHNGDVPGRSRLHRRVVARADDALVARIRGNTDTELAFTLFLELLSEQVGESEPDVEALAEALDRTVEQILAWRDEDGDGRPVGLNLCLTDGRAILATRVARGELAAPSLHTSAGARYTCDDGVCRMVEEVGAGRCAMVSSERLSDDPAWRAVEPDTMVIVRPDLTVEPRPLSIAGRLGA